MHLPNVVQTFQENFKELLDSLGSGPVSPEHLVLRELLLFDMMALDVVRQCEFL